MGHNEPTEFERGRRAYWGGVDIHNNPYGTKEARDEWDRGWMWCWQDIVNERDDLWRSSGGVGDTVEWRPISKVEEWHHVTSIVCHPEDKRTPLEISTTLDRDGYVVAFVVADDGTMWRSAQICGETTWFRVRDLPQDDVKKPVAPPDAPR